MATIGQDAQVFRTCHDAIFAAGQPLLERAKRDGAVRPEVEFIDVIRMVSGVTMIRNAEPDDIRRVLGDGARRPSLPRTGRAGLIRQCVDRPGQREAAAQIRSGDRRS